MIDDWSKLKGAIERSDEYITKLGMLHEYLGDDSEILGIKNTLRNVVDNALYCVNNNGDRTRMNNDENLRKLNTMKSVSRNFHATASSTKLVSTCVSVSAKVNDLLKQKESGEINATDAIIELRKIDAQFAGSIDEYNETLYALDYAKHNSIITIQSLTRKIILDAADEFAKAPDIDIEKIKSTKVEKKKEPNDPRIESRVDENDRSIKMIDRAMSEQQGDIKLNREVDSCLEEVLLVFKKLDAQMESMTQGGRFRLDTAELGYVVRGLQNKVEQLTIAQNRLSRAQVDYSFVNREFGNVIEKSINGSVNDLKDYQYDVSKSMFEKLKNMSHLQSTPNGDKFMRLVTIYTGAMLRTDNSNNYSDRIELSKEIMQAMSTMLNQKSDPQKESDVKTNEHKVPSESTVESVEEKPKESTTPKEELGVEVNKVQENVESAVEERKEPQVEERKTQSSTNDILTASDVQQLKDSVKDLRKYEWVKHSLLNSADVKISNSLREALENDTLKNEIDKMCAAQPPFEYEGELPFTSGEENEIKKIIENLYHSGVAPEDIVRNAAFEIKNNGSAGLQDTWKTLSGKFNGSHKYFYLTREYLNDVSNGVKKELDLAKEDIVMEQ